MKNVKLTRDEMQIRIRYQLFKQKITLRELILERDEDGTERTEKEKAEYKSHWNYQQTYEKFNRYMTSMKEPGYIELCKRLRISECISWHERQEIKYWKFFLEKSSLSISGGLGRPPKEYMDNMYELTEWTNNLVEEHLQLSRESGFIEQQKEEFKQFINDVSYEVLYFWERYTYFFSDDMDIVEINFLELYSQLNNVGKRLVVEILEPHLDAEDKNIEDEWITLYKSASNLEIPASMNNRNELIDIIWTAWGEKYGIEYLLWIKSIAENMLQCKKQDWDCLIIYHQLRIAGKDLMLDGIPYMRFIDETLGKIMDAPCMKSEQYGG